MVSGASDFGQIPVSGGNDLDIWEYRKKGDGLSQTVPLIMKNYSCSLQK